MRAQHAREFRIARTDNLLDNTSITSSVSSSGTLAVQAPSAASSQNVVAKIPTSTIALAIAMSCLGLALILGNPYVKIHDECYSLISTLSYNCVETPLQAT